MAKTIINTEHLESFRNVYREAREIYLDIDDAARHSPHDPVVRFVDRGQYGGWKWRLESGVNDEPDAMLEFRLDDFDSFFYAAYQDAGYMPTDEDMTEFAALSEN